MNNIVDINDYTNRLTDALKSKFGDRLLYVGLQGSYLRGEATPESDIDIIVRYWKNLENMSVHADSFAVKKN